MFPRYSRFSPRRVGKYIETLVPLLTKYIAFEDDELREGCFQTFESFILRCPTEVTGHIGDITILSLEYLKHDPNYDDGEDDEEMEQDGDDENGMDEDGGDEDEEDEGYSDDDDMSWKVRRASAKTIASIISTRTELVHSFFDNIAPTLVKRFKEREESVRVEILQTFIALIRQVGATSHGLKGTANDAPALLQNLVAKLSKNLAKELNGKSVQTRQYGFILLRELVTVLNGGLDETLGLFMASIEASLATSTAGRKSGPKPLNNLNLKIEVLDFLKVALALHDSDVFTQHLESLVPPVLAAISGKFFKVTSEALVVAVELVKVIRPIPELDSTPTMDILVPAPKAPKAAQYIANIYKTVFDRVKVADLDVEVKERSIVALSTLLAQTADFLPAEEVKNVSIPLLVERLRNELTRLTTVRAFKTLCDSPLCSVSSPSLNLSSVMDSTVIPEVATFLRKANRQLRLTALATLAAAFTKFGAGVSAATATSTLNEVLPVVVEGDMNLFPLALELIVEILAVDNAAVRGAALGVSKSSVATSVVTVIVESPHLVATGSVGLDALTAFWGALVRGGGAPVFAEMVQMLMSATEAKGLSKQAYRPIAQSIAALIVEAKATPKLAEYVNSIQDASASENSVYLALNVIGDVGRSIDLSVQHSQLHNTLLSLFNSPSEEIKHSAAFALGNMALGNLGVYMPVLISASQEGGKRRYLVLVALKEVIARTSSGKAASASPLAPYSKDLWALLFQSTEQGKEEGTRTVIAECLGKLSVSNPALYLPELVGGVTSPSAAVRSTVVMAIRYTFTDVAGGLSGVFDDALRGVVVQFLRLLTDPDLNVRHIALATLNSAAHNKPYLISESLPELLPLLYQETIVNDTLIRTVVMGPFKHRVDDGLDARKSAYECMYTLLERCLAKIEIFAYLDRVTAGLSDSAQEIKMLNHMILQRLVSAAPAALVSRLDAMVPALKEAAAASPKPNAVKQEIEKVNELVRSAVRAVLVLARALLGAAGAAASAGQEVGGGVAVGGGSCPAFDEFYREMKAPGYVLAGVVASVSGEVDAQPMARGKGSAMDLS
ncbi:armadillo-type protein [Chytriomyces sp. MP71]|nr:armadillo-type protein [Chytriomyces sp. MP71]